MLCKKGTPHCSDAPLVFVQDVYIRKVEKVNGEPWAVEFATFEAIKDPLKEPAAE